MPPITRTAVRLAGFTYPAVRTVDTYGAILYPERFFNPLCEFVPDSISIARQLDEMIGTLKPGRETTALINLVDTHDPGFDEVVRYINQYSMQYFLQGVVFGVSERYPSEKRFVVKLLRVA